MPSKTYLIGIGGGTCSGKTTLAERLQRRYGEECSIISLDNYYKASAKPYPGRASINHDLPGAFDWRLLRAHLKTLIGGRKIHMPLYDYRIHNRTETTRTVEPQRIIILDGLYVFHDPIVRGMLCLGVFLESTYSERRSRRLERDLAERNPNPEEVIRKFEEMSEPAYKQCVLPTRWYADILTGDIGEAEEKIVHAIACRPPPK